MASAHGSVVDPASRAYGCLERWGNNHLAPEMRPRTRCAIRPGRPTPTPCGTGTGCTGRTCGGNYQAAIPDGTLCSGGHAEGGRYDALDAIGPWIATPVSNNFTVRLFDQASHGADYIRVYVTRQGFDALNQPLRLERPGAGRPDRLHPGLPVAPGSGGVEIDIPVSAPGRTGRHIVYTIWLASHMDQAYFLCSDVTFGGGSQPRRRPRRRRPRRRRPRRRQPAAVDPAAGRARVAAPRPTPRWRGGDGGFQGEVQVTAGSSSINGWEVTMTFPGGQSVQQYWNANISPAGPATWRRTSVTTAPSAREPARRSGSWAPALPERPTLSCTAS